MNILQIVKLAVSANAAALLCASLSAQSPINAPPALLPDEITLTLESVVPVTVNGIELQMEVRPDASGFPVINPDIAARLGLEPRRGADFQFGPVVVPTSVQKAQVDFGAGAKEMKLSWADKAVSTLADGVVGLYDVPFKRVTYELAEPGAVERLQILPLKVRGGGVNKRLGTESDVGRKTMTFIFSLGRTENLITAPTANFIATHQEGGFVEDSDGLARMNFGVKRPTRDMRIAYPIELGDLRIERFAVRVADYGTPNRVGEIEENDLRFDANQILVSRRKRRGKPDRLTRLGRDQIAHCSRLTFDLDAMEASLSCGPRPDTAADR
ncbi:MAG: hypothetical protein AAF692_05655 [Pseudomonadota bacterium]